MGIKPPGLERQEREIARKITAESPIQRDRKEMQQGERGGRGRAGKNQGSDGRRRKKVRGGVAERKR